MRWPLSKRLWWHLHAWIGEHLVNRWGYEPGWRRSMPGSSKHYREGHWTIRLNNWAANHWVHWWVETRLRRE